MRRKLGVEMVFQGFEGVFLRSSGVIAFRPLKKLRPPFREEADALFRCSRRLRKDSGHVRDRPSMS